MPVLKVKGLRKSVYIFLPSETKTRKYDFTFSWWLKVNFRMSLGSFSVALKMPSDTGPSWHFCIALILHSHFTVLSILCRVNSPCMFFSVEVHLVAFSLPLPFRTDFLSIAQQNNWAFLLHIYRINLKEWGDNPEGRPHWGPSTAQQHPWAISLEYIFLSCFFSLYFLFSEAVVVWKEVLRDLGCECDVTGQLAITHWFLDGSRCILNIYTYI